MLKWTYVMIRKTQFTLITTLIVALTFFSTFFSALAISAPAIWKIEKSNNTSYLMGTVHMGDASMSPLASNIQSTLAKADVLYVEVDMSAISPEKANQVTMTKGLLPQGQVLTDVLSSKSYKRLEVYFGQVGIPMATFQQMQPWLVGLSIAQLEFSKLGYTPAHGIDSQLIANAKSAKKKVMEFETLEQQMGFFEMFSGANGEAFVNDGLDELQKIDNMGVVLMNSWKSGDYSGILRVYEESMKQTEFDKKAEKVLLTDRNLNWVPVIEKAAAKDTILVAVGAMHLVGDNGLITLLKNKGWRVTKH